MALDQATTSHGQGGDLEAMEADQIRRNLDWVREKIGEAARRSGRVPESIKLIAVSKTVEPERIAMALAGGVHCLGENRVQEGAEKRESLKGYPFEFHLIGTLQKNKVNKAVTVFDWIQSVDSLELARKISQASGHLNKTMPVLLEVNLAGEASKSGITEARLADLALEMARLPFLSLRGLMAIPPFLEDPEAVRPYFRQLRELSNRLRRLDLPNGRFEELSMGMSHDFPIAIEEGATMVRVGTAIFGERTYPPSIQ